MKPLKTMMLGISVAGIMAGCSSNDVPKCDDSDAKELVLQIATSSLRDGLSKVKVGISYAELEQGVNTPMDDKKWWNALKAQKKEIDDLLEQLSLQSIRTDDIDEKLKKTQCSAELVVGNKTVPIRYKLEMTSDNELYATVYGL